MMQISRSCFHLSRLPSVLVHRSSCSPPFHGPPRPTRLRTSTPLLAMDVSVRSQLVSIQRSFLSLTERLADPDVLNDPRQLKKVMSDRRANEEVSGIALSREVTRRTGHVANMERHSFIMSHTNNEQVVEAFEKYQKAESDLEGATEMFREAASDPEMKEMAREEMKELETFMASLEDDITMLLLPKDPNDDRNVMLEIRAGTGGSEANIFAGDMYDVYVKFCKTEGWRVSVLEESPGDDGGFKNVVLEVSFH